MLRDTGFDAVERVAWTGYDTSPTTRGATFRARVPEAGRGFTATAIGWVKRRG